MEIEKHLFRISQRALKHPNGHCLCRTLHYICFGMLFYYCLTFIIGHVYVLPKGTQLSQCISAALQTHNTSFVLQKDATYQVYTHDLNKVTMQMAKTNNQIVADNEFCTIIKNLDNTNVNMKPFEFTWTQVILYFDSMQRETYKLTNYTIQFKHSTLAKYYIFSMSTILTNQLILNPLNAFPPNPYVKSMSVNIYSPLPAELSTAQKVYEVFKSMLYYTISSVVTSFYIYGTIIAAPAVIIIFLRCSQFVNNGGNMTDVYKIFPWIGMHSLIRQTSQNPLIKKSSKQICWAIIFYFFFMYFVYYAIILKLSDTIFYQNSQQGLEEMFFGFIAMIEFLAITFIRTRPFLKYYPLTHSLLLVMFLIYCQFVPFGLKKNCLMIACTASMTLFTKMVIEFEIPAQTVWDRTKKYTPTSDRPRIGYLPLFSLNWINNLPDEWTMLFPLFGRENFTQREMAYTDRNFQLLNDVLGINQQRQQQEQHNQGVVNI